MVGLILCPANLRSPIRAGRYDMGNLHPSEVAAGGQLGLPGRCLQSYGDEGYFALVLNP